MGDNEGMIARPMLFVGLGSTGAKVISKIKRLIEAEGDPWTANFYKYLRVTSEVTPEKGVDPHIRGIILSTKGLGSRSVVEAFSKSMNPGLQTAFDAWWYKNGGTPWIPAYGSLDEGAGGVRPIGRLLLHYLCLKQGQDVVTVLQSIRKEVQDAQQTLPTHKQAQVDVSRIDCHVFGLLAGGTCSGTFLDLALLIRQALPNARVFGTFLLGDVCYFGSTAGERDPAAEAAQRYNTLYALAEMMVVQSRTGRDVVTRDWVRQVGQSAISEGTFDAPAYHRITLVGATNQDDYYLRDFEEYQNFLAEYYGGLFATEGHAREIGRAVDQAAQQAHHVEQDNPSRANTLQRIGLLNLRVPAEKTLAMARDELAKEIATHHFKNDDRWPRLLERFQNAVSWTTLESQFAPPDESMVEQELDPLPETAEEFRTAYELRKKDLDAFYAPWQAGGHAELRQRLSGFHGQWAGALEEILRDLLGQVAESPFSLGGLGSLLKSLRDLLDMKQASLDKAILDLTNELFADRTGSLEKSFKENLDEAIGTYPGSGLTTVFRRWRWSGQQDVIDALRKYRGTLRKLATARAAQAALEPLRSEIKALVVGHKLVGGEAAEPVFLAQQRAADELFATAGERRGLRQEVIDSREAISKCFVQPILDEVVGGATGQSRREVVRTRTLATWKAKDGQGFFESFGKLVDLLRGRADSQTPENALRRDEVRQTLGSLREGLRDTFNTVVRESVGPAVDGLSVWEALRRYVESAGGHPETLLQNMFKAYAKRAQLFTKLVSGAEQDTYERTTRTYYVCDEKDARECFERLGIASSATFLGNLLENSIGHRPAPMTGTRASRRELILFFSREGDLPIYFDNFSAVAGLLQATPAQQRGREKNWSDRRFPEWIRRWHQASDKPYMLT